MKVLYGQGKDERNSGIDGQGVSPEGLKEGTFLRNGERGNNGKMSFVVAGHY